MRSVLDAVKYLTTQLKERRQAEDLLCDLLHYDRLKLYLNYEQPLTDQEWDECCQRLERRQQGEPLAYIHGQVDFYHCKINISPDVLIPRPETEILVDKIVQSLKKETLEGKVLLDLCSGSGCIGIALKKQFPALTVYLSDISPAALKIAKQNAQLNGTEILFLEGDLLDPFANRQAHYVVCNPPYISENEFHTLVRDVKAFEPKQALVSGPNGLEIYQRLAHTLPPYLHRGAKVWFEIGYQQGNAIQELFKAPPWKGQRLENDWAGHHRFFLLENE